MRHRLLGATWVLAVTVLAGCTSRPTPEDASPIHDAAEPCFRAADCDDGIFCNGRETCTPDHRDSDALGCLRGTPPCPRADCSEDGEGCASCVPPDADEDGSDALRCGGDDCDDADPRSHPGLAEVCDVEGVDEDCNSSTIGETDLDGDGEVASDCCNAATCGPDCDDTRAEVGPFGAERCDGRDDDCDERIDEGLLVTFYADVDDDGFGQDADAIEACAPTDVYRALRGGDCDDGRASVSPDAAEICNGLDDDCSGGIDDGDALRSCMGAGVADARCGASGCEILRCDAGFDDCDGRAETGCESSLATVANCGRCGMTCSNPHGTAACVGGVCDVLDCWGSSDTHRCGHECVRQSIEACGPDCLPCSAPLSDGVAVCWQEYPSYVFTCQVQCEGWLTPVERGGAIDCVWPDVRLDSIEVLGAFLEPAYSRDRLAYAVRVPETTTSIRIRVGAPPDAVLTARLGGVPLVSGVASDPLPLLLGENRFAIEVTAESGAVGTYELAVTRASAEWHYLKASNTGAGDELGSAVALHGDTLIVGAPREDGDGTSPSSDGLPNSGAAYVYRRDGSSWRLEAYLKSPSPVEEGRFGEAVGAGDDVVVVGAPGDHLAGAYGTGAAYVFRRSGVTWTLEQALLASNADASDQFGASVAISGDTIAVGAPNEASRAIRVGGDSSDDSAAGAGAAYVFERAGGVWAESAYVKPINTRGYIHFGSSIALDGDTLVVGAPSENSGAIGVDGNPFGFGAVTGAAYVLERIGGVWSHRAYLKASSPLAQDFGNDVALDGATIAVGTQGEVFVFRRDATRWSQATILLPGSASSCGRSSVGVAEGHVLIGCTSDHSAGTGVGPSSVLPSGSDGSLNYYSGAAHVFAERAGVWTRVLFIKAPNAQREDAFGTAVAIDGTLFVDGVIVVSAGREDGAATGVDGSMASEGAMDSGAVYTVQP